MGKSLFWKGVFLGAVAGGALSLLDKTTRQSVAATCKKTTNQVSFYVKNPGVAVDQVREVTNKMKSTFEQVSEDVSFITEKVEELKEGTPQVARLFGDTKEAFLEENQDELEKE